MLVRSCARDPASRSERGDVDERGTAAAHAVDHRRQRVEGLGRPRMEEDDRLGRSLLGQTVHRRDRVGVIPARLRDASIFEDDIDRTTR